MWTPAGCMPGTWFVAPMKKPLTITEFARTGRTGTPLVIRPRSDGRAFVSGSNPHRR